jgi:hypothetical protein
MTLQSDVQILFEENIQVDAGSFCEELALAAMIRGIESREHIELILSEASQIDALVDDKRRVILGLKTKIFIIFMLCAVVRMFMTPFRGSTYQAVLTECAAVLVALMMVYFKYVYFCRMLPDIWAVEPGASRGYQASPLFKWWLCELILDHFSEDFMGSAPGHGESWNKLSKQLQGYRSAELSDGVCRRNERKISLMCWSRRATQEARSQLNQSALYLPFTEIVVAVLLACGICGISMVDFISGDATIASETSLGEFDVD